MSHRIGTLAHVKHSNSRVEAEGSLHPSRAAHATRYRATSSSLASVEARWRESSTASRADSRFLSASAEASLTTLDNAGVFSGDGVGASSCCCCPDVNGGKIAESSTSETTAAEVDLLFLLPFFAVLALLLVELTPRVSPHAATVEMKRSPASLKPFFKNQQSSRRFGRVAACVREARPSWSSKKATSNVVRLRLPARGQISSLEMVLDRLADRSERTDKAWPQATLTGRSH